MHWAAVAILFVGLMLGGVSPASAHKAHERNEVAEALSEAPKSLSSSSAAPSPETQTKVTEEARSPTFERLLDWLGRLHPSIVHFPLAFVPAALFTAVVGRRRPGFQEATRFLILAGGLTAPVAMLLGWLDGGWSLWDKDRIMTVHRWLGTAIGIGGLALAAWVLVRPRHVHGNVMLAVLVAMTADILVQGWHGGALIHGVDHLAW